MTIRTLLIGLAALSIAGCSAYFSIIGLSTLFAGATLAIMIMAGSMEFSKLVTASFLYMYWDKLGKVMRTYLTTALLVLVIITSMGIYGFLTAAFQSTSEELEIMNRQIENVELRKERYVEQITLDRRDREVMNESVTQLTEGLTTGNVIQYVDPETGQLVTTTSGAQRNILRDQLERAQSERDRLSDRIEAYTDSVTTLDMRVLDMRTDSDLATELGPLQFVAEVLNVPMVQVVNILAILIMFSFDPLAIALVIAFNMSIYFNNKEKFDKILEGKSKDKPNVKDKVKDTRDVDLSESVGSESELKERYDILSTKIREKDVEDLYAEDEPIKIDDTTLDDITEESEESITTEFEEVEDKKQPKRDKNTILQNLTLKETPVKYERDGKTVGYDTSKNGRVDRWTSSDLYRKYRGQTPYYMKSIHNWNDLDSWINDQAAVNYWITNIRSNKYPSDFSSKTY